LRGELVGFGAVCACFILIAALLLRRVRYSLGELLVVYLLTGLVTGLAAKILPEIRRLAFEALWMTLSPAPPGTSPETLFGMTWFFGEAPVVILALFAGGFVLLAGAGALHTLHWAGVREPRRRLVLLLRGISAVTVGVFALLGTYYLAAHLARVIAAPGGGSGGFSNRRVLLLWIFLLMYGPPVVAMGLAYLWKRAVGLPPELNKRAREAVRKAKGLGPEAEGRGFLATGRRLLARASKAFVRLLRTRRSRGELLVLVLATGLGGGLAAKLVLEVEGADYGLVLPIALGSGLIIWLSGTVGLHAANRLGVRGPRRRLGGTTSALPHSSSARPSRDNRGARGCSGPGAVPGPRPCDTIGAPACNPASPRGRWHT